VHQIRLQRYPDARSPSWFKGDVLLYEAMLGMFLIVPYYGESAVPTWISECRYCHDGRDVTRANLRYYIVFIMQRKRDPIINVTVSVR